MRLIDAHALRNVLNLDIQNSSPLGKVIMGRALLYIDEAPTVDATPIVHAHWIEKTNWYHGIGQIHCTCSNCGYTVDYKPGSRGDGRGGKFCDDCGAKMDGEE